jgi:hypothetical protein
MLSNNFQAVHACRTPMLGSTTKVLNYRLRYLTGKPVNIDKSFWDIGKEKEEIWAYLNHVT